MTMPKKYTTYEDINIIIKKSIDGEEIKNDRVQGPEILLDHSEADLRMHYWAGVGAFVIIVLMFVSIVAMAIS
jgi:hypothetical protein